jgi:hypothetical protein
VTSAELDPTQLPGFVTIDSFDASSRAGLEVSYVAPNLGSSGVSATVLRSSAHARLVDKASGLGGYARVPWTYEHASLGDRSDTVTDFGDLEVGAIYVPRLPSPHVGLVLHAGITAPTGEKLPEANLGTAASVTALPEFYNSLPRGTTAKLGVSPTLRSGRVFGRVDLGLDWNLDAADVAIGKGIHYNAGLGILAGKVAVMVESQNLSILDTTSSSHDRVTLSSFAVSARVDAGAVTPYAAVVIPMEDDSSDVVDFAITFGVDFRL